MARIKVGGTGPIFKWESNGQALEGTFLGLRDGKQFPGQAQKSKLLDLMKSNGERMSAGAPTALAGKLGDVKPGTYVWITYTGKARGQTGVEYKNFDVEIDVAEGASAPLNYTSTPAFTPPISLTVLGALEQKLVSARGTQVAGLMLDALKQKSTMAGVLDAIAYETALANVLKANGIA